MQISPAKAITLLLRHSDPQIKTRFSLYEIYVRFLAKVEHVEWLSQEAIPPHSATAVVAELEILIPMAGLIDKDAEMARLEKELNKLIKELTSIEGRLNNPKFLDKAPADVVDKEQSRAHELKDIVSTLQTKMTKIAEL